MSTTEILIAFKKGVVAFLDELIEQFTDEPDLVILRIFLKDQIPIETVIVSFITKVLPLKEDIRQRRESVFIDNNVLFDSISKTKVNHFKRLWRSSRLEKDDKEVVWAWLDSFVLLAEKYQAVLKR